MFRFDFEKSMQALGVLLRQPGKHHNAYLKLIKLMYIAEKESLQETGRPITGDKMVAMPHGPVLSHVCDLIRGEDYRPTWSEYFETTPSYELEAKADIGEGRLCPYEIKKLQEVAERYKEYDRWEMARITHKFPEYKKNKPGKSSKEIPLSDILKGHDEIGKLPDIERAAEADRAFTRALGL